MENKVYTEIDISDYTHDQWIEKRHESIGGSDCGAILGVSKYSSALDVYLTKKNKTEKIFTENQKESMHFGNLLEDVVVKEFERRTGKKVDQRKVMLKSILYPFMTANVDGFIEGENAILECKTASNHYLDMWSNGEVPLSYQAQVHHYMLVGGFDKAYVACLVGGNRFFIHEIKRDEETMIRIADTLSEFWNNNFLKNIEPKATVMDSDILKKKKFDSDDTILGSQVQNEIVFNLRKIKEEIKTLNSQKTIAENLLRQSMNTSSSLEFDTCYVNVNTVKKSVFHAKKLKEDYPEIYELYSGEKEYSVLRIKEKRLDNE